MNSSDPPASSRKPTDLVVDRKPDALSLRVVRPTRAGRELCTPPQWKIALTAIAVLALLSTASPLIYILGAVLADLPRAFETLASSQVWRLTATTVALAASVTVSSLTLAVTLAWIVARVGLPGGRLWLVPLSLPLAVPSFLLAENYERAFGLHGFSGAWIALTLVTYPLALLPLETTIRRASRDLEFAARNLGCGPWQAFRKGALPQITPTLEWTSLLVALYALSDYGAPAIVNLQVLTTAIESRRSGFNQPGVAALSALLCALSLACIAGMGRIRSSRWSSDAHAHIETHSEKPSRPVASSFGLALCLATLVASVGLPAYTVWTWLGASASAHDAGLVGAFRDALPAAQRSLLAAGATTVVAAALSIPFVMLACRHRIRSRASASHTRLSAVALIGYGLPGVVIGYAFVRIGLGAPAWIPLYQTLPLLLLGYLARCLAESLGPVMAAGKRLPCERLDAARSLGAPYFRAWMRVGVPALAPGIIAGSALTFLTVIKELPITLILRPTGFDTLAFELFDSLNEAVVSRAAPHAALLLILSGVIVAGLVASQRD